MRDLVVPTKVRRLENYGVPEEGPRGYAGQMAYPFTRKPKPGEVA